MTFKGSLVFAIAALTVGSNSYAGFADLMTCQLEKGGQVRFSSDRKGQIDMDFNTVAANQLGVQQSRSIQANMEAKASDTTRGAIELLEIGHVFSGGPASACSAGFWFATSNMSGEIQTFGSNRSIPLANESNYNVLICGEHSQRIVGCTAGKSLNSVSSLKMFLRNEIGD